MLPCLEDFDLFWGEYWVLNSELARQALYHLSHSSSPLCSGLGEVESCFLTGLDHDSLIYISHWSWNDSRVSPHPVFFCWDGSSPTF
jgi:hypothetical protein